MKKALPLHSRGGRGGGRVLGGGAEEFSPIIVLFPNLKRGHTRRRGALQLGVKEGVVFLSYSSLISGCDNGSTRIQQLLQWCGPTFDGLLVFDECHK